MKTEVDRTGIINRSILINCLVGKCPFPAPNGHHQERSRTVPTITELVFKIIR
jgi:hypothetical protein